MIRCKNCQYWSNSQDDGGGRRPCKKVLHPFGTFLSDTKEEEERHEQRSQIAEVEDTEGHYAVLKTKADFGCVEGKPK